MRAVVFTRYGSPDVLELKDVPRPSPKDDEVLVRVRAASINDWDAQILGGAWINRLMVGIRAPKKQILGSDIAGRIEAIGARVTSFRVGDEVFGDLSGRWGGFAEYVCAREDALARKSPAMTWEQAAAFPQAGLLALQGLRAANLKPCQTLLINGAGGGVGTFAVQLARLYGVQVTAVDHTAKLEMLRAMGVDQVIDYTREDFTRSGRRWDAILDVKTTRSLLDCGRALKPNGVFVTIGGSMTRLAQGAVWIPWLWLAQNKKVRVLRLALNDGLTELRELFDAGRLAPVIDGPFELSDLPQAFRHFAEGRHKGKIVITM